MLLEEKDKLCLGALLFRQTCDRARVALQHNRRVFRTETKKFPELNEIRWQFSTRQKNKSPMRAPP